MTKIFISSPDFWHVTLFLHNCIEILAKNAFLAENSRAGQIDPQPGTWELENTLVLRGLKSFPLPTVIEAE